MNWLRSRMFEIVAVAAIAYAGIAGTAFVFQRKLLYVPDPTRVAPARAGLDQVREVVLARPDGAQVVAWYGEARPGRRTILYFHGNGGNLAVRAQRMAAYIGTGDGMLMMSYRGYSGSTGSPTEHLNVADAKAAYDWLIANGVAAKDIVLYGESLGSGVAVQVALAKSVAGVILDAPYTSIPDVGQRHYWYLPVKLLALDRYPTERLISRLKVPLLIIHGEHDQTTPVEMGRAVFAAANEPKKLAVIAGAGHDNHHAFGAFEIVQTWMEKLESRQ